jgi:hypothetical protein
MNSGQLVDHRKNEVKDHQDNIFNFILVDNIEKIGLIYHCDDHVHY